MECAHEQVHRNHAAQLSAVGGRAEPIHRPGSVTYMGFATPQTWVDVRFRAAYLMATRELRPGSLTGRLDWFDVQDRTFLIRDNNDENGWAATTGWRQPLTRHADLLVEAQRIHSKRLSRALAGEAANQTQNVQ